MDEKVRKAPKIPENLFDEYCHILRALLAVLHVIQEHFGYVPEEIVPEIAGALNLSRTEIHAVICFYHLFRNKPPGKYHIQNCRVEACQVMDSVSLEEHSMSPLSLDYRQTTVESG